MNWLIITGLFLIAVTIIHLNKPDTRFKAVIKKLDEEIMENEEKLKKQNIGKAESAYYKTIIETYRKCKYHWLEIREYFIRQYEKNRHNKIKLKAIQNDWFIYVGLIEKEKVRYDNPDPNEEDHNEANLTELRMEEIEKRFTAGLPKKKNYYF